MSTFSTPEIIAQARRLGLTLKTDGERLLVFGDTVPSGFAAVLKENKPALMSWLTTCPGWQSVPPVDLPLNPNEPRPSAEDRERMIAYVLRQIGDDTLGPLARWINVREDRYYTEHKTWDCSILAFSVARDCACWQLNRTEREVLELIRATSSTALGIGRSSP